MNHPVTREEFESLRRENADTLKAAKETHDKVAEMHKALIEPSPGQTRGLLDRMAAVTISIESGERVAGWIVRLAAVLAALGVIATAFWAFVKLGHPPEGSK